MNAWGWESVVKWLLFCCVLCLSIGANARTWQNHDGVRLEVGLLTIDADEVVLSGGAVTSVSEDRKRFAV